MPGGATVRIHDIATQSTDTMFDRHSPEALAVADDGGTLAVLAREPGRPPQAFLVNTFRSGTARQYAADFIDDGTAGELSLPAVRDGASWFLRKVPGGWRAVVATEQ
jgi:alkylation response protein AidB-like acyl-CoA dehydrogenase